MKLNAWLIPFALLLVFSPAAQAAAPAGAKNVLFLIADDLNTMLGAYGDPLARTPNIDRLAREGAVFTRAFTHCGVCAPSRSGMITGRYPLCYGGQNMRSVVVKPPRPFTEKLRAAGYRVCWPDKTDFNGVPIDKLADSRQDWLGGPKLQEPFFAFLNLSVSHEGKVNADMASHADRTSELTADQRRDPTMIEVPPFYPDDPEVRQALARYHELVTVVDGEVGRLDAEDSIDRMSWRIAASLAEEAADCVFNRWLTHCR
jgi:uncharacterized sulfatase